MKRERLEYSFENPNKDCKVTKNCLILCQENDSEWIVSDDNRLPSNLRHEYETCRKLQILQFQQALTLDSDEETEEYQINNQTLRDVYKLKPYDCDDDDLLLMELSKYNTNEIREWISQLTKIKDVRFATMLGIGRNGIVFEICNPDISSQRIIVKFDKNQKDFQHEFKMQELFYESGFAPKPIGTIHSIFIMGKIDGTLGQLLKLSLSNEILDQIIFGVTDLLFRMCDANVSHKDMHWDNIGYVINIETKQIHYILIDFGMAQLGCNPQIELAQLIRTTFFKLRNVQNMKYLQDHFIILFETNFPDVKVEHNRKFWDRLYITLLKHDTLPTSGSLNDTVVL
jgi:predicted Ser/Thr protein kinase